MSKNYKIFGIAITIIVLAVAIPSFIYEECRIDVPKMHMAILTHKTGLDIGRHDILAPTSEHKGVMNDVLTEGRYYYNPYDWTWEVVPQVEIPEGSLGVRIRMYGENLSAGELIARKDNQKGIVAKVLNPGRYAINACVMDGKTKPRANAAEIIELHKPVTVPAGFKGLVTELTAEMPREPNQLVSEKRKPATEADQSKSSAESPEPKERGVQAETWEPGTYYINPYVQDVRLIDCRSKRYDLKDIGFPTKDGFWVSLEAIIEFRVKPDQAAKTYILFNEEQSQTALPEAIIAKVILPNARSYTRIQGSNFSGSEFITGDTRVKFQAKFQETMKKNCDKQGIEVIQALITNIKPPEKIADPVRRREIALQQKKQFEKEIEQQKAESKFAVEKALVLQKQEQVAANKDVVVVTTEAMRDQRVAEITAGKRLEVAQKQLEASQDQAAAIMAKGKAAADVIKFANEAEAAGWQKSVAAFSGNGNEFARWTLLKKLAPAFRAMMINTDTSPLMDVFKNFDAKQPAAQPATGRNYSNQ
jgi:regulator of protease activity HflC (stomatin/prohibitin superfamily)